MYLNNEVQEVVNNYLIKVLNKKILYIGRGMDIAEALFQYIKADYTTRDKKYDELIKTLWKQDTKHISEVFEGRSYGALKLLLGESMAEGFKKIWDRATLYSYTVGYTRRAYRSNKASELYRNKNIDKLIEAVYLAASDFSLDKYFADNKTNYKDISIIADIISVELDNNNHTVFEKIRDII